MTIRRILVTGAGGYIGSPTVRHLIAMGHEVHALGRTDPKIDRLHFHALDLLDPAAPDARLREIDADTLLHLAWFVEPGKFWTDLGNLSWVGASLRLFRAFAESGGRRIVGIGSCAEYDWSQAPLDETSRLAPHTLYGTAKASLWKMLEALSQQEKFEAAWGRIFFIYGPGEPRGKLVADTICALLKGEEIDTTEGTQLRDFMYIDDVGRALAALTASHCSGPVNIASGTAIPVRDILAEVERATSARGLVHFGARPLAPGEPKSLACTVDRLRSELDFKPRYSLAAGVEESVNWWRREIAHR